MNKKPIVVVALFLFLAGVALVYGVHFLQPETNPPVVKRKPAGPGTPSQIEFQWELGNPYVLKNSDGSVSLDLRVTGKPLPNADRKPLNLVLVIDRSGSMGDERKLEQVKEAAAAIAGQLTATDRLGIVIYDDTVSTLIPSTPVENRERILSAIYRLSPGGSTNLYGGLDQGFAEVRKNFRPDSVNRILFLSDGLANAGVTDPRQIEAKARQIRERSISVSAMGVGTDYNETLMTNIADASGGNYYYISRDMNMAEVFRKEWNLMQSVVATNAVASLELGEGVDVVDVAGFKWEKSSNTLNIQIPDIYSGESRRLLVQLHIPAKSAGKVHIASGTLSFTEITGKQPKPVLLAFEPSIQVVEDQKLVQSNVNTEVLAKTVSVEASRRMEDAYRYYEEGRLDDARRSNAAALESLRSLGYLGDKDLEAQEARYRDSEVLLQNAPSADSFEGKNFLKKQKEEDRKAQQSTPQ